MKKQFNPSNLSEIRTLLNVALACLDAGEMDRLAWRLADAAGILREELAGKYEGGLCGLDEPTGRGYVLPVKSEANPMLITADPDLLRAAVAAMTIVNRDSPDGSIAHDLRAAIAKAEGKS